MLLYSPGKKLSLLFGMLLDQMLGMRVEEEHLHKQMQTSG